MLIECEGDRNAGVWDGGAVVGMRVGNENVGATCRSGIVSNAADVLGMSVVRGMKGVGGVCKCLVGVVYEVRGESG